MFFFSYKSFALIQVLIFGDLLFSIFSIFWKLFHFRSTCDKKVLTSHFFKEINNLSLNEYNPLKYHIGSLLYGLEIFNVINMKDTYEQNECFTNH